MSQNLQASGTAAAMTTPATATGDGVGLRTLYYARFAFAVVWAALFAVTSSALTPISIALLVLYPLVDAVAAAHDVRSSGGSRPRRPLVLNLVLSLVTTIALAVAAAGEVSDVLRVWGAWAIAAGLVQVVVAVRRRHLDGQRVLILSGGISVVAGAGFVAMAGGADASLAGLAGYATLGGIFFLVSAIRLGRSARTASD